MSVMPKLPDLLQLSMSVPDRIQLLDASQEIEFAAGDEKGAKLPSYSMVAYTGVAVNLGNFPYPVVMDLTGMKPESQNLPNFAYHDPQRIVGHTTSVEITTRQVKAVGLISGSQDNPDVKNIGSLAKNGFKWQVSIGAAPKLVVHLERGQSEVVNGRRVEGPAYIVKQSVLREISFVPLGADGGTSATVAAAAVSQGSLEAITMGFDQWLKAKGFDNYETLGESAQKFLKAMYEDELKVGKPAAALAAAGASLLPAGVTAGAGTGAGLAGTLPITPADDLIERRRIAAAEAERQDAIRLACVEYKHPRITVDGKQVSLEAHAIEQGWTLDKTKLEALQMSRPVGPAIHCSVDAGATQEVVLAACCQMLGLEAKNDAFTPQIQEQAGKLVKQGIGLQWLIKQSAIANGYSERIERITQNNLKGILKAAFAPVQASSSSTISLPGFLGDVTHRLVMDTFNFINQSWREIAEVDSVNDFKTVTTYRLTGDMTYERVASDGELTHGEVGETSYTNKAETYGKIFTVSRQDIVNDDLGALRQIAKRLGRGAAVGMNKVFWTEFLDNADFFSTGNENYFADATGSSLDLTGLTKAFQLFKAQTDEEGEVLGAEPRILLVPSVLYPAATSLMKAAEVREYGSGATQKSYPTANPFAGQFKVIDSPYLGNASYAGSSNKAWYLLADPLDLAVIQMVFLNGQQVPNVETAEADFNQLGIQMRGYHDLGVKKREYRGGVKMKGEA